MGSERVGARPLQNLIWAYAVAKSKMNQAAEMMKQTYDHGAKDVPLLIGQRVWVRDRNRQGRGKLCGFWDPLPYMVVGTLGETGLVEIGIGFRRGRARKETCCTCAGIF